MTVVEKKNRRSGDFSIVTARVPSEIRKRGNEALKNIGSSPTELVNAAYDYVIANNSLPEIKTTILGTCEKKRELSRDQAEAILERRRKATFAIPASFWKNKSDKELIADARKAKYEALT